MNKLIVKRVILIFFGLGLFFGLEGLACLVLPGNKLNLLESIHTVCCEENELLWRQKKQLNTVFQGKRVITNSLGLRNDQDFTAKTGNGYKLICLGGSSTFGWGVDQDKTYPKCLESLLNNQVGKKKVEVINAGQIGYSSYQGKIFLKKYIIDYNPDIITISYVLNDIDKIRFFKNKKLSDSQIMPENSKFIAFKNNIVDKRMYFLAKRFIFELIGKNEQMSAAIYKNQYENSTIRVTAEEYKNNLEYFIRICRAEKIKLIFIVMPINLDLPDSVSLDNGIILGDEYYQMAKEYERIKNYKRAEFFYKKALDYQVFICKKNGALFQNIMFQVARENNIPAVNVPALFYNQQNIDPVNFFNGPDDTIHPNPTGHMIIANALKECIEENKFIDTRE